ncbi:Signal transduction histidine kinase [Agromyces sp. CF514]|uniref:sensor histidine kinase n=1 Tax=Agromyces sp. CF514 TaxID=1881031 RepID=UPI0008DF8ADF|nr:HAMP domain-containing sensor histidine kinase [Agromyces sp. CF514]SFR74625.1 Signal transduction histidine kinase [Agromyces sp. CF514]
MRALSIRARITLGASLIAILLLAAGGIVIYAQVERIVRAGEEAVLAGIEAPYLTAIAEESAEELDPPGHARKVLVTDASGQTRLDTMPDALAAELAARGTTTDGTHRIAAGGNTYLVRTRHVESADGTWMVSTARDFQNSSEILDGVMLLLIVSLSVIAVGFGAAAWFISTAALRPVTRLQRSAERLSADEQEGYLPTGPVHDEIEALARTLNDLIRRTRESADRERQVVSDASHELRTPLAILNAQLEVAAAASVSDEQRRADVAAARSTLQRLIRISQGLLDLSRMEAQRSPGTATLGALSRETADAVDRARTAFGERDPDIDFELVDLDPTAEVALGAQDFGRMLDNLISNAVCAASADARPHVLVTLTGFTDAVRLSVVDRSGGMDPDFVGRAFERFARGEHSGYPGGGLGLPIVARAVENAGGDVALENRPGDGLTVRVALPVISGAAGDPEARAAGDGRDGTAGGDADAP